MFHRSVLVQKVLEFLLTADDGVYVDATIGDGGHALAILNAAPKATVIGIDSDKSALETAKERLKFFGKRLELVHGDFENLDEIVLEQLGYGSVDGVLFDLGLRSAMVEDRFRGFSFKKPGPLDMRFNTEETLTAYDVVNRYSPEDLERILREYGDVRGARKIVEKIVDAREKKVITTTEQLAEIVVAGLPQRVHTDVLARVFQAIRIEVNREFEKLERGLYAALEILRPGGRLVVISYHSGEDRIVKHFMATESRDCICPPGLPVCRCGHKRQIKILTKRVVRPSQEEIRQNPRARSARLRAAEKL